MMTPPGNCTLYSPSALTRMVSFDPLPVLLEEVPCASLPTWEGMFPLSPVVESGTKPQLQGPSCNTPETLQIDESHILNVSRRLFSGIFYCSAPLAPWALTFTVSPPGSLLLLLPGMLFTQEEALLSHYLHLSSNVILSESSSLTTTRHPLLSTQTMSTFQNYLL